MIKEALLYEAKEDRKVQCNLCNHRCSISDGNFGICGVRQNREGVLYTHAYGQAIAANVDPIEKKPLYHFLPGTTSFSVAAAGCNFRCGFCQNWQISQIPVKQRGRGTGYHLAPEDIVNKAREHQCRSISYTYTEPTIFFEYAYDIARLAKESGIYNVFVTNGYMTVEALNTIRPYLDACNVDLKAFSDAFYRNTCHGRLEPVLASIRTMRELGIWVEITTLVIPGENDDVAQLDGIARFIAGVGQDIPWHISRFHPDFQFDHVGPTPLGVLKTAYSLGKKAGLQHIYVGNVPGETAETRCPECGKTLIRRHGFFVEENLVENGACPACHTMVAGVF